MCQIVPSRLARWEEIGISTGVLMARSSRLGRPYALGWAPPGQKIIPAALCARRHTEPPLVDAAKEGALFGDNEPLLLGEAEVGRPRHVRAQARAVCLVVGEALEGDQPEGNVIGTLVGHPVTLKLAAARGNDPQPALGITLEGRVLERGDQ